METYIVNVKVKGEWEERYKVEAKSKEDAENRWTKGQYIDSKHFIDNRHYLKRLWREVINVEKKCVEKKWYLSLLKDCSSKYFSKKENI